MKKSLCGILVTALTLSICVSVLAQTIVFPGRVVSVAGGDTVTVLTKSNTEFQVRCHGIIAPKGQENFAADSRQRLSNLLLDEPVRVEYRKRDHDGTLIGKILLNDRNICLEQVQAGMAWHDDQSELSRSIQEVYAGAESSARENGAGLWTVAPSETKTSSPESVGNSSTNAAANETGVGPSSSNATVNVRGYFRKDGTYVAAHKRTSADNRFSNNWSTEGNVNPYTGEAGKKKSRWKTALKWIAVGASLGALIYLDAKYPNASARCNDGTYSYSRNRRGTCSHHGGVAYWLY